MPGTLEPGEGAYYATVTNSSSQEGEHTEEEVERLNVNVEQKPVRQELAASPPQVASKRIPEDYGLQAT